MAHDPVEVALIEEVLEASTELAAMADSARAEVWASGVLGLWNEPGAAVDPATAVEQLLAEARRSREPGALALALAVAAVTDPSTRRVALEVAETLEEEGVERPSWVEALGTSRPACAWVIDTATTAQRTAILEFAAQDGSHTMLADLDAGRLTDVVFGPPSAELFSGLEEPGADALEPRASDVQEVGREVVAGWEASLQAGVAPTESWVMNRAVALRRLAWFADVAGLEEARWPDPSIQPGGSQVGEQSSDNEFDEAALEVLRSALGQVPAPGSAELTCAADTLRARLDSGEWPAAALSGGGTLRSDLEGPELLASVASAFVTPGRLRLTAEESSALASLEWADWLGVVIELVRAGAGAQVAPGTMVDHVNRCPEVTTSIPRRDREHFEYAFGVVLDAWRFCGFVDEADRLTEVGRWALPTGLERAWSAGSAADADLVLGEDLGDPDPA